MHYAHLSNRQLLTVHGEDATPFLQGLISNDSRKLEKGEAIYATLLTPQGKYLHDFFLVKWQEKIWIDTLHADALKKRLMLYKLRSKVTIELAPATMGVVALWGADAPVFRNALCFSDPRLPALGARVIGDVGVISEQCIERGYTVDDYEKMRLNLGIPQGHDDLIPEKSFLLEWGVDQLHGVDYQKGCYVGQEVTARTHYRGHVKKAPYIVRADNRLPEAGSRILCGEAEAGELRSSSGTIGLALLRIEEVEKATSTGMPLRIGDQVIEATQPEWFASPASDAVPAQ